MLTQHLTFFAAALIAVTAAGTAAADPAEFAVDHFNASADNASERVAYNGPTGLQVTVSARGDSTLERTIRQLNASADNASEMIGTQGATVVEGTPAHGAEIFEWLRSMD